MRKLFVSSNCKQPHQNAVENWSFLEWGERNEEQNMFSFLWEVYLWFTWICLFGRAETYWESPFEAWRKDQYPHQIKQRQDGEKLWQTGCKSWGRLSVFWKYRPY